VLCTLDFKDLTFVYFSYSSTLKQRLCFAHATHPLMASML
jgi:hypothetical protein